MEIKIVCACGTKYKFDVEPVDGRMPGPVYCPVCRADGTEAGNQVLSEKTSYPVTASSHPAAGLLAPVQTAIPSLPISPGQIRIPSAGEPPLRAGTSQFTAPAIPRSSKEAASQSNTIGAEQKSETAPPSNPLVPKPPGTSTRLSVAAVHPPSSPEVPAPSVPSPAPIARAIPGRRDYDDGAPSNKRGIIGAAIGGLFGMTLWYLLIVITHREFGYAAWGVGLLTGFCAKKIGRGESTEMGVAAALAAALSIIGGEYLAVRHVMSTVQDTIAVELYNGHIDYAKEAVKAKSDGQVRAFLESERAEEEDPAEVTPADIKEFRNELPKLQRAANGQLSLAEYRRTELSEFMEAFSFWNVFKSSFGIYSVIWIALGVGSAYKLASAG